MIGTLINVAAVIIGSIIGVILHNRFSKRFTEVAFQTISIFTIFLGISMAFKSDAYLIVILSLISGALIGEALNLELRMDKLSERLKSKLKFKNDKFSEGFITAFLLFCMGSMTIQGAIEEGQTLRILELKKIRVLNMLPALFIIILLTWIKDIL